MKPINNNKKIFFAVIIVTALSISTLLPSVNAKNIDVITGFDKGPSFTNVVPTRKITFVNLDEQGILDDYAYFAALPTAVFYADVGNNEKKLFSHPLLFYQDKYEYTDKVERTLNARQGIDYFMEDWMSYSNNRLDQMTLINVPLGKVNQWPAREYVSINGDNPFLLANQIALNDWSYSNNAVVAVIEGEYEKPNVLTRGSVSGSLDVYPIKNLHFEKEPPSVGIGSTHQTFDIVDQNYKYISAELSWTGDMYYDIQLIDEQLGMVAVDMGIRGTGSVIEQDVIGGASYIHNYGPWRAEICSVPMKTSATAVSPFSFDGSLLSTALFSGFRRNNLLNINVILYPGTNVVIEEQPPFGCRDVEISLSWNNPQVNLGFTVLDPVGNEIASSLSKGEIFSGEVQQQGSIRSSVNIHRLGECIGDDYYSVVVFSLDDVRFPVDFTVDYSWKQEYSKNEGDGFVSASNGAVLASMLNAPLLYISPDSICSDTVDVLYKLGVEDIYLVNLGGHLSKSVTDEIRRIANVRKNYVDARDIYDDIRSISGNNDVIFSTIEPWHYWYAIARKPAGIKPGSLHLGPAAYLAAHHGSPVIVVDYHPELSQAVTWSVDWWIKNAVDRIFGPPSSNMVLTARRGYDFLEEYDFGKIEDGGSEKQIRETIITVADQFQIGIPWDRSFLGAALSGRFWGSPVDVAYSISRSVFYPALVYENPAMDKVTLTQGSSSTTEGFLDKLFPRLPNLGIGNRIRQPFGTSLRITQPMQEEEFEYPILHMYNTYLYRFNEIASKHWDFTYTQADGITPYLTPSPYDIDNGAAITKTGKYYPDISESEVIPFYAEKAGYGNVFSTNFDYVTKNLNEGVLIWIVNSHGWHMGGGMLSYWNPDTPYVFEENPWRAYEPVALKPGNLGKYIRSLPFHWYETLYADDGEHEGLISILGPLARLLSFNRPQLLPEVSSTKHPDTAAINFQLERWASLTSARSLIMIPDVWNARGLIVYRNPLDRFDKNLPLVNYYQGDGKVTSHYSTGHFSAMKWVNGFEIDDALGNLHSVAINSISCMPSNTYMQLCWMRHGTLYQIMDPWTTTDWAGVWQQMIIKQFALGDTVGEAFERGIRAAGPLYSVDHWWWDIWQNICLFGNPSQRVFVPSTEYSDNNYWTRSEIQPLRWDGVSEIDINGHMPFGATEYPLQGKPLSFLEENITLILIACLIIIILIICLLLFSKKKQKNRKR